MDDKHRVLRAVFSDDKGTTKQLNEVLTCTSFHSQSRIGKKLMGNIILVI